VQPQTQAQRAGTWPREPVEQRPRAPLSPPVGAGERVAEPRVETWSGARQLPAPAPGEAHIVEPGPPAAGWGKPEPWLEPEVDDSTVPARELFLDPDDEFDGNPDGMPAPAAFPEPIVPEPEGMRFPKFVERPSSPQSDRVDLTYDSQVVDDVVDLPASALLFEAEPEEEQREHDNKVFDLRAFGATEFDK
jgi:hypothetical protein